MNKENFRIYIMSAVMLPVWVVACREERLQTDNPLLDTQETDEDKTTSLDSDNEFTCRIPDTSQWPEVCIPQTSMGTTYTAISDEGIEIKLVFDQHFLLSVDEQQCTFCNYSTDYPGQYVASSFYNCDIYYSCGDLATDCRYHLAILTSDPPRWMLFGPSENMENSEECRPYTGLSWDLADAVDAPGWCAPNCSTWSRACGPDGCGGTCGTCNDDETCADGICKDPNASDCPSACLSPSGLTCCEPPFCSGDCVGSPCC